MHAPFVIPSRRSFLHTMAASAALFYGVPGAFAEELTRTAAQTEGPFYPDKLPLDTDNDLLNINDATTPGIGEVTYLSGKVLDTKGSPIKNALVEIWQCDAHGIYMHSGDSGDKKDKQDKNFQGFGRFLTGKSGEYLFRTIKPVSYPGRTPHIHVKVKRAGKELLTTQCYIKGHELNARDGVLRAVKDEKARESIIIDFAPIKESKTGELAATFNIVLGMTPES